MIKWKFATGGYYFFIENKIATWDTWKDCIEKEEQLKYQILKEYVDNNLAEIYDSSIYISFDNIYGNIEELSTNEIENAIRFLGFPVFYTGKIFLNKKGDLHSENLHFKISYCGGVSSLGPVDIYPFNDDSGNILVDNKNGNPLYMLNPNQYEFVKNVKLFNNLDNKQKNYRLNLDYLAKIKNKGKKALVEFHKTIKSLEVYKPEKINIDIKVREDKNIELIPAINEYNEGFQKAFTRRNNVDEVITVQQDINSRIRIPVTDEQRKELKKIKNIAKRSDRNEILKIIEKPEVIFDPEIVDYSVFYSERVLDIGLYKPKVYPFISPYKSEWIPGYIIENKIDGEIKVFIKSKEELIKLKEKIQESKVENKNSITINNNNISIDDAELIIEKASKQLENKKKKINDKRVLIIKENAELLEYEENYNIERYDNTFEDISGLMPGISLKKHQIEGVAWMQSLYKNNASGCLLADDMGLGKTLQALSFIHWLGNKTKSYVIIVAPVALIENWQIEYLKFFKNIPYDIMHDRGEQDYIKKLPEILKDSQDSKLIIISYATLRKYQLCLAAIDWTVAILDEAQNIKTPGIIVTNAAKALKVRFKIAITGTPVENSFHDIWSIMDFCVPGLLGSSKEFSNKYSVKKNDKPEEIEQKGDSIRKKIGIFIKRRLKDSILVELPNKYNSNKPDDRLLYFKDLKLEKEMPDVQITKYKEVLNKSKVNKDKKNEILKFIGELKRISDHPFIDMMDLESISYKNLVYNSARTIVLIEILKKINTLNEKAIVFAEYRSTQRLIAHIIYEKFNIYPTIINGSTPTNILKKTTTSMLSRQQLIDKFNNSNGFNVIIMSPIAAGVGLNVTGANHVIHYSRHWNPAKEDQATDRAYRIGQKKDVFVYYPKAITKSFKAFDVVLDELLQKKRKLSQVSLYPSGMVEVHPADVISELTTGLDNVAKVSIPSIRN